MRTTNFMTAAPILVLVTGIPVTFLENLVLVNWNLNKENSLSSREKKKIEKNENTTLTRKTFL